MNYIITVYIFINPENPTENSTERFINEKEFILSRFKSRVSTPALTLI